MAFFTNTEQLYQTAGGLFTHMLVRYPEAIQPMYRSRLIVRLSTSSPGGQIWVNARYNPLHTAFGDQAFRPELDIQLSADNLHLILLGELSLPKAVGNGAVKVRGPVFKLAALAELFAKGQVVYPDVLREQGITY